MRNTIILGTVRSGTSMTAALFRDTGASFGDDVMAATISNPYGYYECHKINRLNNRIIQNVLHIGLPRKLRKITKRFRHPVHVDQRASMLAVPEYIPFFAPSKQDIEEIQYFANKPLFCYKDPRFSITLPFWRKYFPEGTRYVVVFRDPKRTVDSMLRNSREIYKPPLPVDEEWGFKVWQSNYYRLLKKFSDLENWLFIHDELLFNGDAVLALESFTEAKLNSTQINPGIRRSKPEAFSNSNKEYKKCIPLYEELIKRSEEDIKRVLALR